MSAGVRIWICRAFFLPTSGTRDLTLLDHEALHGAAEIASDIGKPRHGEAGAIGTDPGFRVEQNPLADRLPRKADGEVGIDEGPFAGNPAPPRCRCRNRPRPPRASPATPASPRPAAGRRGTRSRRDRARQNCRARRAATCPSQTGSRKNPPARRAIDRVRATRPANPRPPAATPGLGLKVLRLDLEHGGADHEAPRRAAGRRKAGSCAPRAALRSRASAAPPAPGASGRW